MRQFEVVSIAIDWLESLRESCESGVMDEATARELGGFFHPTLPCECEESGILFCGDPVVVWFHQNHVVVRRVIRSILWTYGFNLRL
ncbi:hypothetical protein EBS80_00675 [bacterium]|nr:hypothetical protein [bacterium]